MRRAVGGAILALVAVTAVGCGSDSGGAATPSASPTPTTPTPTPTPEIILWAGQVCVARDALLASVTDLVTNLSYDPAKPGSVGEQFQAEAQSHLDEVNAASEGLGAALGGVPLDYVEAAAALSKIQEKVTVLNRAKDEALGHVSAAQQAGDPVSGGVEWLQAAVAAKATFDAGMDTLNALSAAKDATNGDVGDAFATAPECR